MRVDSESSESIRHSETRFQTACNQIGSGTRTWNLPSALVQARTHESMAFTNTGGDGELKLPTCLRR